MGRRLASCLLVLASAGLAGCGRNATTPTSPTSTPGSSPIVTLVDVTDSVSVTSGLTGTFNWAGQSVSVPSGGAVNNVRFNWYTSQGGSTAFGTLYLLTQEYLGLPRDLGSSTRGFVAHSERVSDGQYIFAAGVTLAGGAKYWFYTDTQGSFVYSFDADIYPAGDLYVTGYQTYPFHKAAASGRMMGSTYVPPPPGVYVDANFRLQGSIAAIR